jgi:hypothetical protein
VKVGFHSRIEFDTAGTLFLIENMPAIFLLLMAALSLGGAVYCAVCAYHTEEKAPDGS